MKNTYFLVPAALALLVAAHEMKSMLGPSPSASPSGDGKALLGRIDWNLSAWTAAPAGRCPSGHVFAARIGNGGVPRLGRATLVATHCLNPSDMSYTNGRLSIIAANGDELHGTYYGHSFGKPPQLGWVSYLVLSGGTGRFASALGYVEEFGRGTLRFDSAGGPPVGGDGWSKMMGTLSCGTSTEASTRC